MARTRLGSPHTGGRGGCPTSDAGGRQHSRPCGPGTTWNEVSGNPPIPESIRERIRLGRQQGVPPAPCPFIVKRNRLTIAVRCAHWSSSTSGKSATANSGPRAESGVAVSGPLNGCPQSKASAVSAPHPNCSTTSKNTAAKNSPHECPCGRVSIQAAWNFQGGSCLRWPLCVP